MVQDGFRGMNQDYSLHTYDVELGGNFQHNLWGQKATLHLPLENKIIRLVASILRCLQVNMEKDTVDFIVLLTGWLSARLCRRQK